MHDNIHSLFSFGFGGDMSAASYFEDLPEDVKRIVSEHAHEFHSVDEMKKYVENLLKP
ncbi:hypothetical protein [Hydrogenoanaerobacterium sp.]|uniref:hypothetical protein n=1 Tax=Hydrogenoanaerobacterium sp. TaxID=2953763 RepID=UPI002896431E|nr:hypothetical protein [Hydrogenoanaerobacterium sp.]